MPAISEEEFRLQVEAFAALRGWLTYHTHDSRKSREGFPDEVFLRGPQQIVAELKKSADEKPTLDQQKWLAAFEAAGVPAYVWYPPECWEEIQEVLQ